MNLIFSNYILKLSISFLIFFSNQLIFSQSNKNYFVQNLDTLTNYKIQFSDKSGLMPDLDGSVNKAENRYEFTA